MKQFILILITCFSSVSCSNDFSILGKWEIVEIRNNYGVTLPTKGEKTLYVFKENHHLDIILKHFELDEMQTESNTHQWKTVDKHTLKELKKESKTNAKYIFIDDSLYMVVLDDEGLFLVNDYAQLVMKKVK